MLAGGVVIRGLGKKGLRDISTAPGSRHCSQWRQVSALPEAAVPNLHSGRSACAPLHLCADFFGAPAQRHSSKVALPARHLQIGSTPSGGGVRYPQRSRPRPSPAASRNTGNNEDAVKFQ
ncbi:hypothetical protein NDU88_001988 [Pleurodeles waltl]|uniref:Uncharacterized protein n=1 Tax=Pleurodeles waltl TaxID=8319 RepID=A0AAV7WJZ7_PLEWA|nr:hypothetical protein NDU88_001988 [Pleurodeles waltl]